MGFWRQLMRVLGLSSDARVHISAPGIDVVITGDPEQVRALLLVVKHELERNARWRDRTVTAGDAKRGAKRSRNDKHPSVEMKRPPQLTPGKTHQYVQPSELDEMDSPYALPDPLVMPVEETTDETEATRSKAPREESKKGAGYGQEIATLVPDIERGEKEEEREDTDVKENPSGPTRTPEAVTPDDTITPAQPSPAILRNSSPFVTDGGPTLTPLSDSDPGNKLASAAATASVAKRTNPPPLPHAPDPRDVRTLDSELEDSKETPPPGRGLT